MIDATAALPLHFTLETIVLSAAGLSAAWAILRRAWAPAAAAAALLVVQGLHAGQFIADEDEPALVALRLASLAVFGVTVALTDPRRTLIGSAVGLMAAGAIWGAIVGGGAEELAIAPHLVSAAGGGAAFVWVWYATRPSVRLRVLAAFVSVLAVTVVVAGGAVARVAAVDARNERYSKLGLESATMLRSFISSREVLVRRAATLSSVVAVGTSRGKPVVERSRVLAGEWVAVLNRSGRQLTATAAEGARTPQPSANLARLGVVKEALKGEVSYYSTLAIGSLHLIGSAPVYRPGSPNTPADVIGAVVVGRATTADETQDLAADPTAEVVLAGPDGNIGTEPRLIEAVGRPKPAKEATFETIDGSDEGWLATVAPVPGGDVVLVVAASDDVVVEAASDLVRAFLVAILAAALLAVVAGLWLSTRITRPMLQLADDAERVKADFLASVSHELRTPLTPIRGYTEILRSRAVPARDASGYLDEIGLAAQRLERVVALLVDVSSIEAGRFRVLVEDVPPADLLDETVQGWQERSSRRIAVKVPRSLPDVVADASAIGRVLDELIDNAVKFAPDGPIELSARRANKGVEFTLRDHGPGIDPERLKAVREAFHQEDSGDTRRFGGLGLGLTFVEGVLDAHGSSLSITSEPGAGTTCSFTLPAAGSVARMPPKAQKAQTRKR